jgi:heat shock protein HslJ
MRREVVFFAVLTMIVSITACKTSRQANKLTSKSNDPIEKYWKLDQIMGKEVSMMSVNLANEPFITLKREHNILVGNSGCNNITGSYEVGEGNRIRFYQVVMTLKSCLNMDVENELKKVLEITDNYHMNGDTLILNRARMAPLARFIAVYK